MNIRTERDKLNETIILLRDKRVMELGVLKKQAYDTCESLKPIKLIKRTMKDLSSSAAIKNDLIDDAIAITTGFLSRKLWVGGSHNPLKKLFGTILQFTIGNFVSNHSEGIRAGGENLLERFLKHRKESKNSFQHSGKA